MNIFAIIYYTCLLLAKPKLSYIMNSVLSLPKFEVCGWLLNLCDFPELLSGWEDGFVSEINELQGQ